MVSPPLPSAPSYLTALHESGLSYSSVNTARSVLSSILVWEDCQTLFGQLPIVKRFMKAFLNQDHPYQDTVLRGMLKMSSIKSEVKMTYHY